MQRTWTYAGQLPSVKAIAAAKWQTGLDPDRDWDLLIAVAKALEPISETPPSSQSTSDPPPHSRLRHLGSSQPNR